MLSSTLEDLQSWPQTLRRMKTFVFCQKFVTICLKVKSPGILRKCLECDQSTSLVTLRASLVPKSDSLNICGLGYL